MVHEAEIEMAHGPQEEVIDTVSINSVYLNRNQSLITAQVEMEVGKTTLEVPYKIDTGSEGKLFATLYIQTAIQEYAGGTAKRVCKRQHKAENI